MSGIRLQDYLTLRGTLHCVTGLRIGAAAEEIEIGGLDNPIIKHPLTGMPYVPGSSLKGKMRALLEFRHDKVSPSGDVHTCAEPDCLICRVFGTSAGGSNTGPSRLIVRDAYLTDKWKATIQEKLLEGEPITEIKYENTINRINARANPRPMERVPAGVEFTLEIGYRVFDTGDGAATDRKLFQHVIEGLQLVAADTLGGSGSRGYGKVAFTELTLTSLNQGELAKDKTLAEMRTIEIS